MPSVPVLLELQLKNFKAFEDTGPLPIRPITLIYGPNSSGKSSLIQSLLLFKQSFENRENPNQGFVPNGWLVNLGNFREFVHAHDTSRPFEIRVKMCQATGTSEQLPREGTVHYAFGVNPTTRLPELQRLELLEGIPAASVMAFKQATKRSNGAPEFELESLNPAHPVWDESAQALLQYWKQSKAGTSRRRLKLDAVRTWLIEVMQSTRLYGNGILPNVQSILPPWIDSDESHTLLRMGLFDLMGTSMWPDPMFDWLRTLLGSVRYIGPLREYPERYYTYTGNQGDYVGKSGKGVSDFLFKDAALIASLNQWLKRLQIPYEVDVDVKDPEEQAFSIRLKDRAGVSVNLLDVGFGISQVLPVLVQSLVGQEIQLVFEQPELHLHPRLQAELGDLFAAQIRPPFNNRFLIETHSENLLLRIKRLIRRGELKPEDVAVVYVDPQERGSVCLEMRIDADGDFIDRWPNGFFEEDFQETFGL